MLRKNIFTVFTAILLFNILIPRIALAGWQNQKTHWPRLIYKSSDLPLIKQNVEAAKNGVEPYKTLWDRINKKANLPLNLENKDWGAQNTNASIIKARAFIYAVTGDKTKLDKIRDELLAFYTGENVPEYSITAFSINTKTIKTLKTTVMQSIHMAQSLTLHVQTYDILKGAGYDFGSSEQTIQANIATLAKRLYNISNWISSGSKVANIFVEDVEEQNNFQLKISSAVGLAAMCLNNDPAAEKWISRAITKFWQVFNAQTTPQGGYGEGPFYFTYAGLNFLPFFKAYNNFMEGKGGTYDGYQISNFLSDNRVMAVLDWHIKIRMPNGDRPGYDDGYYAAFPTAILMAPPSLSGYSTAEASKKNSGFYAWDWYNTEQMEGGYDNRFFSEFANLDLTVDIFCNYDAKITPVEPKIPPTQYLPEAGNTVFRSGWDKNAVYLHLLGENGPMRIKGGVHEHPDAGSFVIYAYGELLTLDAGYPGYPQHDLVNKAKNHNVLLVDDAGPTTDAFLENFFDTPILDGVSVRMNYGEADIIRTVFFVDNQYFIINDQLSSAKSHTYSWLLHGYGGTDVANSSFAKNPTGGVWKRTKASLEANVFTFPANPIYEQDSDYHSIKFAGSNQLPKHSLLRVKVLGTNTRFTSVLYPAQSGTAAPTVQQLSSTSATGFRVDSKNDGWLINLVRGNGDKMQVNSGMADVGTVTTDGDMVILAQKNNASPIRILCLKYASTLSLNNNSIMTANQKCNFVLVFDENKKEFSGYFDGKPATSVELKWIPTQRQASGVSNVSYQSNTQTLKFDFSKAGYFRIF